MAFTKEENEARLANARKARAQAEEVIQEVSRTLGIAVISERSDEKKDDVATKVSKETQDAELYQKLSPAQRTELYLNDRARFEEIVAAHEAEGTRKLLNRRPW